MTKRINSPAQDSKVGVNDDGDGILGLIIAEEGQFKTGRGRFTEESLNRIVELGNAKSAGIRKRAQHPTASDDGLGSYVGRETNYRIDTRPNGSKVVRADMLFSEAAMTMSVKGGTPWGKYLIKELSDDPGSIQNSIVLRYDELEDEHSESGELAAVWLPTELSASDFVDSGDATHGDSLSENEILEWLSEGSDRRTHAKLPSVVTDLLDRAFPGNDRQKILSSLNGFVERYDSNRFGAVKPTTSKEDNVDQETQAALAAQKEEMSAQFAALSKTVGDLASELSEDRKARKAELSAQKRATDIASLCNEAGSTEAAKYIADESLSIEDVRSKLFVDMCNQRKLSDSEGGDVAPSEFEKLGKEWDKDKETLLAAGWAKKDWLSMTAKARGIEEPAKDSE